MRSFKPIRDEALSLLAGLGILLLLLAVIFCSFVSLFSACSLYEDRVITEQTRVDGVYTVKLLQTSEAFLFGGVSGAVALYDQDGKRLDYAAFHLGHDTVRVEAEDLIGVVWGEQGVTVTVSDHDDPGDQALYIPYPKK